MIGASKSKECQLNIGSPQGAILSPTIFIILIADVGLWTNATVYGYADDTTTTVSGNNLGHLTQKCQEEASKLITFMSANKLSANDDKTHIMCIRRRAEKGEIEIK